MTDLFEEEEDDLLEGDSVVVDSIELEKDLENVLDARRKLEKMLEDKRLQDELDDFLDY